MRRPKIALTVSLGLGLIGLAAARAETLTAPAGPYAVVMEMDSSLPGHTVYRPADLKAVKGELPVVAFGNGGCFNIGNAFQTLLGEVASYGYVVAAPGPIQAGGEAGPPRPAPGSPPPPLVQSAPDQMTATISWAVAENSRKDSPYRGRLDLANIAVMGQSCGGLEAIAGAGDRRVKTALILNSGIIRGGIANPDGTIRQPAGRLPATEADIPKVRAPIAYLIGGPKDQAYAGAEVDFQQIQKVPLFNANIQVGHGGTWNQPHAGPMGEAAIAWLNWRLKGDKAAARTFAGPDCGLCKDPRWTVKKKNMD
jgi:dienelactone hydrolase